jgi:ligand-binding SRPBCC domain-containing protein
MVECMRRHFVTSQWLPYPVPVVFAFLANPQNLPLLMPPSQKARMESAYLVAPLQRPVSSHKTSNVAAGEGSTITLSFRPFPLSPVRQRWEALITEFQWNDHFCDRQVRGPFALWEHCHGVRGENGGTLVTDEVNYEMKLGAAGDVAHSLFVSAQMEKLFIYRQRRMGELLAQWHAASNVPLRPAPCVERPLRDKARAVKRKLRGVKKRVKRLL